MVIGCAVAGISAAVRMAIEKEFGHDIELIDYDANTVSGFDRKQFDIGSINVEALIPIERHIGFDTHPNAEKAYKPNTSKKHKNKYYVKRKFQ